MKISIYSDCHIEFRNNLFIPKILKHIKESDSELVIDAGDLHPSPLAREQILQDLRKIKDVIFVEGNHDFYHGTLKPCRFVTDFKGYKIVGATLWINFKNENKKVMNAWPFALNDWRLIRNSSAKEILQVHYDDLEFIEREKPDIVVTHHTPSLKSLNVKKFGESDFNFYFHNDLDHFILENQNIKLWIHGHTHDPSDYVIGDTRVICNPVGYPSEIPNFEVKDIEI